MKYLSDVSETERKKIMRAVVNAVRKMNLSPSEKRAVERGDFGFDLISDCVRKELRKQNVDVSDDDEWDWFLDENEQFLLGEFIDSHAKMNKDGDGFTLKAHRVSPKKSAISKLENSVRNMF